jgi:hypothetical protein
VRSRGPYPSLGVTLSIGITSRPTFDQYLLDWLLEVHGSLVEVLVEAASSGDARHIMLALARYGA